MTRRTSILLVAGAGGVGKTTIAAAAAVDAAARGINTLVVTVDPAMRLADALGVGELGNRPARVEGHGNLWAAMLDVTASWEAIVARHAEPDVADRLLANPFFRAIADRFPAAQAYAAGEQMAEFVESSSWDLVVVDTPPSVGGIDFLLSPGRMSELVGGRLLHWMTGARIPGRKTLYRLTARPMLRLADTVLGGPLLQDIAEFLLDLRTIYDGMSHRARSVERHLRMARIVVVTNADPTPMRESRRLFDELPDAALTPAAVVFNRELPPEWETARAPDAPPSGIDASEWNALVANLQRWSAEARHKAETRREFAARHGSLLATVPLLMDPPTDLESLAELMEDSPELRKALFGT